MRYGYARVSTIEQDNAMQIAALKQANCDIIIEEKRSAVKKRPKLDELLLKLERGDYLIIYKLDRLARSLTQLLQIIEQLNRRGVHLKSVTEPIDAGSSAGRLFLQMLGAFAEFERNMIRERCMAGQLEALKAGKRIGRPYSIPIEDRNEVIELIGSGIPHRDVADAYGISTGRAWQLHAEATGRFERKRGQLFELLYRNKKPS